MKLIQVNGKVCLEMLKHGLRVCTWAPVSYICFCVAQYIGADVYLKYMMPARRGCNIRIGASMQSLCSYSDRGSETPPPN